MLYGDAGTGKSGVMNYVTNWAYKKNWIVMKVTNCYFLTHPQSELFKDPEVDESIFERHEVIFLNLKKGIEAVC